MRIQEKFFQRIIALAEMTNISVIIPTYNRRTSLRDCLRSIFAQKPADCIEVVVVDDGSTDGTGEELKEFILRFPENITYVRKAHEGISKARNTGISRSRGRIIALTDDDCIVSDNWLEKIAWYHANFPEVAAVQGKILNFYKSNTIAIFEGGLSDIYSEKFQYHIGPDIFTTLLQSANCSFKKEILFQYGLSFKDNLSACEDVDFGYQIVNNKQKILFGSKVVVYHKFRNNLISFVKKTVRDERNRLPLEAIWLKENPLLIETKSVDMNLFYNFALRCIRDYKFNGFLLIGLHIFHKALRTVVYWHRKQFDNK